MYREGNKRNPGLLGQGGTCLLSPNCENSSLRSGDYPPPYRWPDRGLKDSLTHSSAAAAEHQHKNSKPNVWYNKLVNGRPQPLTPLHTSQMSALYLIRMACSQLEWNVILHKLPWGTDIRSRCFQLDFYFYCFHLYLLSFLLVLSNVLVIWDVSFIWDLSNSSTAMIPLLLHGARDCASSLTLARQALYSITSTTLNASPGPGHGFLKLCPTSLTVACCTELGQSTRQGRRNRSELEFWKARVIPSPDPRRRR